MAKLIEIQDRDNSEKTSINPNYIMYIRELEEEDDPDGGTIITLSNGKEFIDTEKFNDVSKKINDSN